MSALRAYRALPAASGVWFLVVGVLGRLPSAMLQIGALLLVASTTGSLAAGGAAAAAVALGQAVGGPVVGRLADRHGHRGVGVAVALAQSAAIVLLVVLATRSSSVLPVLPAALAVGVTMPQIAALARARWSAMTRTGRLDPAQLGTALGYEGAADETTYVFGPALVGLLVAAVSPQAAMLAAAALTVVFATGFALHPTALLVGHRGRPVPTAPKQAEDLPSLWLLVAVLFCVGMFFASAQTGVTAIAVAAGSEGSAGLVYAAMGATSAVAGLLTPALPTRFTLPARLVVFPALLLVLVVPLLVIGRTGSTSLPLLTVAVALAGSAVAPTLITAYSVGERTVGLARMSWAMTMLSAAIVLGYAAAALLGGSLAQQHGAIGAFVVTSGGVAVALALTLAGYRRFTRLCRTGPSLPGTDIAPGPVVAGGSSPAAGTGR